MSAIIQLITGKPGNGKTLNTLKEVHELHAGRRPIYYYNIPELTLPGWIELQGEEWKTVHELPEDSVIVMDEVDRIFPPRPNSRQPPPYVDAFTMHRHRSHDFYLITQHPGFIDHKIKQLCGRHVHYHRIFGSQRTMRSEWSTVVNPDNETVYKRVERQNPVKFDKEFFKVYKSAASHESRLRLPPVFWWMVAAVPIFIGLVVAFFYIMPAQHVAAEEVKEKEVREVDTPSGPERPQQAKPGAKPQPAPQPVPSARRLAAVVVSSEGYAALIDDSTEGPNWQRAQSCKREIMGGMSCMVGGVRYQLKDGPRPSGRDAERNGETPLGGSHVLASRDNKEF